MSYELQLAPETRCWVQKESVGWLEASVSKVLFDDADKKYTIELTSDMDPIEVFSIRTDNFDETNDSLPQLRNYDDDVDDLTTLSHLNEPSVLNAIKVRYGKNKIYTYSGIVLVAMNPFDDVRFLYENAIIKQYQNSSNGEQPPHLFAIANKAYELMKTTGESQSIIVSGESGAGKTVSAKYIMRFFANANTLKATDKTYKIEKQILATNPIMEAFGNAKTTRNDNSSRFGKYLEIQFDKSYKICGAKVKTFLLERSRLVFQPHSERNYHIFYQMIKGLPNNLLTQFGLETVKDYYYLYQGKTDSIDGIDDASEFKETCNALSLIGIAENKQVEIYKILAALLHIGNIHIHKARDSASVADDDFSLIKACELLGLNKLDFSKWIVKKRISTRADSIVSNLKFHQALIARDSITKYIYSALFHWLCGYINLDLSAPETENEVYSFIGVLDIYGFEHFDVNSFEQFCINYANEKLQQEFTQHVFKLQQEEYSREEIKWSFIEFTDNQECINLIEGKNGILSLLDEQSHLPSGSEQAWAEKMFHSLSQPPSSKVFKKARFGNEKFIVSHYALDVTYTVEGFLEKNKDTVSEAQNETLRNTSNTFLSEIIANSTINEKKISEKRIISYSSMTSDYSSSLTQSLSKMPSRNVLGSKNVRSKKQTLGSIFKTSLIDLMSTIDSTEVHYIRCIKPNESKTAWKFDNIKVLSQLRACGVLETIKISMVGFQSKLSYNEFLDRFFIFLNSEDAAVISEEKDGYNKRSKEVSKSILDKFNIDVQLYQMGKTKIFFKSGVLSELEIAKTTKVREAVITLQKFLRGHSTRIIFQQLKLASVKIQSLCKGFILRQNVKVGLEFINMCKALIKGNNTRKSINETIENLVKVQATVKANQTRIAIEKMQKPAIEEKNIHQEVFAEGPGAFEHAHSNENVLTISKNESNNSSPEEFSTKNTDTSFSDNEEKLDSKMEKLVLTNSELEIFNHNSPEKALEITATLLIKKMDKISNLHAEAEDKYESKVNSKSSHKVKEDFEREIMIFQYALKKTEFDEHDRGFDKPNSQRRFSQISKRSSLISTSTGLKFNGEEAKKNYEVSLNDLKSYMKGSQRTPELLTSYLMGELVPPAEEHEEITIKDVLGPSRSVIEVMKTMWKLHSDGQSVVFLHEVVKIFQKKLHDENDSDLIISRGAYLLNNLSEISKFLSSTRESLMYDLFSTKFGDSKRRSELMRLLLIMKRYFDAFFGVAYNSWMKAIVHELEKRAIDAIVLDTTLAQSVKNPNVFFRHMFDKGPKYKMFDLIRVFSNVFLAMKVYFVEKKVLDAVAHDLLVFIDSLCFNDLIKRENFLTVEKGTQLKYNISLLIDWCHEHQIPDSPDALIHFLTLCQILTLKKQGLAEPVAIAQICECLSVKQVERILNECCNNDLGSSECSQSDDVELYSIPLDTASFENAFIAQR